MTPKLIISSLVGITAVGGATGSYYYFKSKDTEKTQTSKEQSTPTTQNSDTQIEVTQPVQERTGETTVQAPVLNPERTQGRDNTGSGGSDAGREAEPGARGEAGPAGVPSVGP